MGDINLRKKESISIEDPLTKNQKPPGPVTFHESKELLSFATLFLRCRMESLKYDVERSIRKDANNRYAPIPALLYCFSIIDLLGALYSGQAAYRDPKSRRKVDTTENSKIHTRDFIYPKGSREGLDLLWRIYRHKTIHLSMPRTALTFKQQIISLDLDNDNTANHLTIIPENECITIGNNCGSIRYAGKFVVDIGVLMKEIEDSVWRPTTGYMDNLKVNIDLQDNFYIAINQLYDPADN